MSDRRSVGEDKLVVASRGALAVAARAALARRGLDLLELRKQSVRIVVGDYESNMGDMFVNVVRKAGSFQTSAFCTNDVDTLMDQAKSQTADLFIVVLNSLMSHGRTFAAGVPRPHEAVLQFVRDLKNASHKPIIAVCGYNYSGLLKPEAVLAAGADFFSWLPIEPEVLIETVTTLVSVDQGK